MLTALAGTYDPETGYKWIKQAADTGLIEAERRLGDLYNDGLNGQPDHENAIVWWSRAAEKSDAPSQLRLARAHAQGRGTTRDFQAAYIWASLSALQGNSHAITLREKLRARLRPEELEKADMTIATKSKPAEIARGGPSS
ncbi:MAG: tetratricopeptide repeat protein [Alphaproteobacteria bacterium]